MESTRNRHTNLISNDILERRKRGELEIFYAKCSDDLNAERAEQILKTRAHTRGHRLITKAYLCSRYWYAYAEKI